MKTSRTLILSLAAVVFFFALQGLSFAAEIGEISNIQGKVGKTRQGWTEAKLVKIGDTVSEGDIIVTKADGKAEIKFNDGSVVRLAPETRLNITRYISKDDPGAGKRRILGLLKGKISAEVEAVRKWVSAAGDEAEEFEVHTPTAVIGVKGTHFFAYYLNGVSGAYVVWGMVDMHNPYIPHMVATLGEGDASVITAVNKPPRPSRKGGRAEFLLHTEDTTIDIGARRTSGLEPDDEVIAGILGYPAPEPEPDAGEPSEDGDIFPFMDVVFPPAACL